MDKTFNCYGSTSSAADWLFIPANHVCKSKLNARRRIFHGNKAYEKREKVMQAFYKMVEQIQKYEPEVFAELEKQRTTGPARDLRAPPSPEESE